MSIKSKAEVQNIFDLLERGGRALVLSDEKDVILVFGATGSGKSTFTQWIAGDNSNLISKETFTESGEYLIEDTNDKIGSTTVSKTLFPELVTDVSTGTSFYDFPGFSDTRGSSQDIAASFLTKSVIDHSKNVKILFMISYFMVQEGMDRTGFRALLKNIDDLIGDADKFKDSIALVVTKVDNVYIKQGKDIKLKADSVIIKGIANFLLKAKDDFEAELKKPDISDNSRKFSTNAIKIINHFLKEKNGQHTCITLFRRPDKAGSLDKIKFLMQGKLIVKKIISATLASTQIDRNDFGYTISDTSKLEIGNLVLSIHDQITERVGDVATCIEEYLKNLVEPVRIDIGDNKLEALDMIKAHEFALQADYSLRILSDAVNFFTNLRQTEGIGRKLAECLIELGIEPSAGLEEEMSKFHKYIEFFQLFQETAITVPSLAWEKSFQSALTYLTESTQFIGDRSSFLIEEIYSQVSDAFESIVEKFHGIFHDRPLELEVDKVEDELKKWHALFVTSFESFSAETTLKEIIDEIASILSDLCITEKHIISSLKSIDTNESRLKCLNALKGIDTEVIATSQWKACIKNFVDYLDVELDFNALINSVYKTFSQYKVQSDVSRYDVQDLSNWGEPGHLPGIYIDQSNFKIFIEKIKELEIETSNKISNITPSETQISILNDVLKITLKERISTESLSASDSTIVFKANFVKFSDFLDSSGKLKEVGWGENLSLEILALNTLFIDQDLSALGKRLKLSIVAPKWEVIGIRSIELSGSDGVDISQAASGSFPGGHAQNGQPGFPGGSAGAFFGLVSEFVGSENLTIYANGGNGGPGQSGGNGANGQDGITPPKPPRDYNMEVYTTLDFRTEVGKLKPTSWWSIPCLTLNVLGKDGTVGGNSGQGGVGGKNGFSGQICVVNLSQTSNEIKNSIDGKEGSNGVSGEVGLGGHHGDTRIFFCKKNLAVIGHLVGGAVGAVVTLPTGPGVIAGAAVGAYFGGKIYPLVPEHRETFLESRGSAKNGVVRNDGNSVSQVDPLPARTLKDAKIFVRNFHNLYIKNSNERFVRLSSSQFYQHTNINPEIRGFQDSLGLIEDFRMLETFGRESQLSLLPFYEFHLKNIEHYSANPKEIEKSDEFKKVLNYLFTATLAKMSNLKRNLDSDLVIDVGGHLDIVSQNIKRFVNLQDNSHLIDAVETQKNNFKTELDKKKEIVQNLINTKITPELSRLDKNYDRHLVDLVREVIVLQNDATHERDALIAKRAELEKTMIINTLFKGLSIVGKVCLFLGPLGATCGFYIGATTAVAKTLLYGESLNVPTTRLEPKKFSSELCKNIQDLGNSAMKLSSFIKADQASIQNVTRKIKKSEKVIKKLENFETKIYNKLIPLIDKMGKDLIEAAKGLESKSNPSLDVIGWQVQSTLRDTSLEIQKFTRGFKVHESMVRSIEKLQEVMMTLIKVYERIQDFQQQQRLAVYMADLSTASAKQIVVSNPSVSNNFRDLQISIQSNIILNHYDIALKAFKQWIFPFAEVFLEELQLREHLISSNTELEALASTAVTRIEEIRSRIQKYKTTIEDFDKHIYLAQFKGSSTIMKPFYIWKNEEHREMITKLLAGKSVLVKADITDSAAGKDAIKFNFVEFGLKSDDPAVQAEVDRNLLNYVVSMTHLGNSFYRYGGQYFSIPSSSQTMEYSVEKGTIQNNVYKKLLSGDIMLSPYAMWELRFSLNPSKPSKSVESLENFADKVDLVLEGSGSFVNTGDTVLDVASYYKVDDLII